MLRSITVKDYMAANLVTFKSDMDVLDAIDGLVKNRISGAPVVDEYGNLVGILSEQDCMKVALNASYFEEAGGRVADFMSRDVKTVDADASILEVAELFMSSPYRRYPVTTEDDNVLLGQVSRRDILRALQVARSSQRSSAAGSGKWGGLA